MFLMNGRNEIKCSESNKLHTNCGRCASIAYHKKNQSDNVSICRQG